MRERQWRRKVWTAVWLVAGLGLALVSCTSATPVDGTSDGGFGGGVGTDGGMQDCGAGRVRCAGACVDLKQDNSHCGACGQSCPSSSACAGGQCVARTCLDTACSAAQVCPGGAACVERTCVGVSCATNESCVAGACQSTLCNGVACAMGLSCVQGQCVDRNCEGVSCPFRKTCVLGACVSTEGGQPVRDFGSGAALGAQQQSNSTHINRGVLGEATPPVDGVAQSNGRNVNRSGVITGLQKP